MSYNGGCHDDLAGRKLEAGIKKGVSKHQALATGGGGGGKGKGKRARKQKQAGRRGQ